MRLPRSRSQVQTPYVTFQNRDDVILRFHGALRRNQERLDSVMGPAGNHYLHEVGRLGVERFHDRSMQRAPFICARGVSIAKREPDETSKMPVTPDVI